MSQPQIKLDPQQIKDIIEDYEFDTEDILKYDDEFVEVAEAVKKLPKPDYIILLLYSHLQSQRKVGKILGVSHSIIGRELRRIREEIQDIINAE